MNHLFAVKTYTRSDGYLVPIRHFESERSYVRHQYPSVRQWVGGEILCDGLQHQR